MKRIIVLFALLFTISTSAVAFDDCSAGSWSDPVAEDGRGIDFQMLAGDRGLGYFYTWRGNEREIFLLISEDTTGSTIVFDSYQSLKGSTKWVGTATIDTIDSEHIIFSYDWIHDQRNISNTMRWCNTNCRATAEYTHFTRPAFCFVSSP